MIKPHFSYDKQDFLQYSGIFQIIDFKRKINYYTLRKTIKSQKDKGLLLRSENKKKGNFLSIFYMWHKAESIGYTVRIELMMQS